MEDAHERTLVVETGIQCNNRCGFCYENGYRRIPGYSRLVPSDVIRDRIRWGVENGFTTLSLTGGEPTIRKDFKALVEYSRSVGFQHVSVTTNGSMLSDPRFFSDCVRSGLDGVGVSIHGRSSAVHDAMTGRKGAFAQAIRTLSHCVKAQQALGHRRFRLNTFTVIHGGNVKDLDRLTDMLGAIGVRLMILQPQIIGKANFQGLSPVALDDLLDAIRKAAAEGASHGYLIKPFNIPPCMLGNSTAGIDLKMYERSSFREHDSDDPGGRSGGEEVGFVRLSACGACRYRTLCYGLSVSFAPMSDMVDASLDAIVDFAASRDGFQSGETVWLTGTELLDAQGIERLINAISPAGCMVCTGGTHRLGDGLAGAVISARRELGSADRRVGIALVHQARDTGSADRILCESDNSGYLLDAFNGFARLAGSFPLSVCGTPTADFMVLLGRLAAAGLDRFAAEIRLSPRKTGQGGDCLPISEVETFVRDKLGPRATLVFGYSSQADPVSIPAEGVSLDDGMLVPPTPFDGRLLSILNWSQLRDFGVEEADQTPPLGVRSINVAPFR